MNYPKDQSTSLYDYSDKSVPQAGYAAIVYGVVALASVLLAWLRTALYGVQAPVAILVAYGVIMAAICGGLAFGIFRRSKVAIVSMLLLVVIPQLYTWFVLHSVSGTLVSVLVTGFLIRGAVRIFERPEEELTTPKV